MWKCFQNGEEKWEAFCKMWWAVTEWRKPDDVDIVGKHWMCGVSEQNRRGWITASHFWKAQGSVETSHFLICSSSESKWVKGRKIKENRKSLSSVDLCCFLLQTLSLKMNESNLPLNITVKTIVTETRDQVRRLKDRLLISFKPDEQPIASDSPDKLVADWPSLVAIKTFFFLGHLLTPSGALWWTHCLTAQLICRTEVFFRESKTLFSGVLEHQRFCGSVPLKNVLPEETGSAEMRFRLKHFALLSWSTPHPRTALLAAP